MQQTVEVIGASDRASAKGPARRASVLVRPAPESEAPGARDRAGAQAGMLIVLLGGGSFWTAVAVLVLHLAR